MTDENAMEKDLVEARARPVVLPAGTISNVTLDPVKFGMALADSEADLRKATGDLFAATEAKIEVSTDLERKIAKALVSGNIAGKNEKEREAATRQMFAELFFQVEEADAACRLAQHRLRLAQITYDHLKLHIRLMETINNA
jgi:hypothetical protein